MNQPIESDGRFRFSGLAWGNWLGPVVVGLIGLAMIHHPMLFSGLTQMQVEACDTRLINYLLEHSFRWIARYPQHRMFWEMPFFYPAQNVGAYSDTMLGVAPIYWGWRAFGFLPDTAFQLWMLSASVLNYVSGYWLFRRGFRKCVLGSTAGAFLFAFAAARSNQLGHQQLLSQVYVVVTLMALLRIFSAPTSSLSRSFVLWSIAGLSVVAQLYTAFYVGWFLLFALGLAAVWGLILAPYRMALVAVLKGQWLAIGGAALLSSVAISPFLTHYLQVVYEVGMRPDIEIGKSIPFWRSWIYMGDWNWIWAWTSRLPLYYDIGLNMESAQRVGIGMATPLVCLAGLALRWQDQVVRLAALTLIGLLAAITRFEREIFEGAAMGLWVVCVFEFPRGDLPTRGRQVLGGLIVLLGLILFPALTLARAVLSTGVAFLMSLLLPNRGGIVVRALILAGLIGFPCLTSYWHRPRALLGAVVVAAIIETRRWLTSRKPPLGVMVMGGVVLGVSLWLFRGDIIWWVHICDCVPGGRAIRVVSRGVLLAVVPAALGVACFFEWVRERRKYGIAAFALGLFCMAEQGVTTETYDKYTQRTETAELVRRIDRRCKAFYYSPQYPLNSINHYHLDGMWAELETGIPTINGYSGMCPPDWRPLYESSVNQERDVDRLGPALRNWARSHGLGTAEICWVRGPTKAIVDPKTVRGWRPAGGDQAESGGLGAR
jgi:hypothetical protein